MAGKVTQQGIPEADAGRPAYPIALAAGHRRVV